MLGNIKTSSPKHKYTRRTRLIDDETIANFQTHLREEAWDSVYNCNDVNKMFNNFHCILLRHFENSFPILYKTHRTKHNDWITRGIKISCKRKRILDIIYKHANNPQVKEYYRKYCHTEKSNN
jgi:hypothetical protein